MAHYVAELIQNAEAADESSKAEPMRACADAIFALWEHRQNLPYDRPLGELEPIVRAIESLDVSNERPFYAKSMRELAEESNIDYKTRTWLKLASKVDHAARVLISHCLTSAASDTADKSAEWIKLAEDAGFEAPIESIVLRFIRPGDAPSDAEDVGAKRQQVERRIKLLRDFRLAAEGLESELRRELDDPSF